MRMFKSEISIKELKAASIGKFICSSKLSLKEAKEIPLVLVNPYNLTQTSKNEDCYNFISIAKIPN